MGVNEISMNEYYYLFGLYDIKKAKEIVKKRNSYLQKESFLKQKEKRHIAKKSEILINLLNRAIKRKNIYSEEDLERILSSAIIINSNLSIFINNKVFYCKEYKAKHKCSYKEIKKMTNKWMCFYPLVGEKTLLDVFLENNFSKVLWLLTIFMSVSFLVLVIINKESPVLVFIYLFSFFIFLVLFGFMGIQYYLRRYLMQSDNIRKFRNSHLVRIKKRKTKSLMKIKNIFHNIAELK